MNLSRNSYGPLVLGGVLFALGAVLWCRVVAPLIPERIWGTQDFAPDFVDVPGASTVLWRYGKPQPGGVLFAGDSRITEAVKEKTLAEHGVQGAVGLMGPMGQVRDVLRAAREMPMRRLVLALSPLSVFAEEIETRRSELAIERDRWSTQRLDDWIGRRFVAWRRRTCRPIEVRHWGYAWFGVPRESDSNVWYEHLLRMETRAVRSEHIPELERALRSLVEDGWEVACVRLPVSVPLRAIEDRAFPAEQFSELCQRVGVPYLDYPAGGYQTADGSHLTIQEAGRFTEQLISDLARVAPTLLAP